jgi:hypothetical protein
MAFRRLGRGLRCCHRPVDRLDAGRVRLDLLLEVIGAGKSSGGIAPPQSGIQARSNGSLQRVVRSWISIIVSTSAWTEPTPNASRNRHVA